VTPRHPDTDRRRNAIIVATGGVLREGAPELGGTHRAILAANIADAVLALAGVSLPAEPEAPDPHRPQILDACCGGRMWWWDKSHPLALYMDKRRAPKGSALAFDVEGGERHASPGWSCEPDVIGDFRAMPFADEAFQMVVFDPPHNIRDEALGVNGLMYGALPRATEQDDLRMGFRECWRVLAPGGSLIVKWAGDIKRIRPHFPAAPVVGTRSPRGLQTWWLVFYKPLASQPVPTPEPPAEPCPRCGGPTPCPKPDHVIGLATPNEMPHPASVPTPEPPTEPMRGCTCPVEWTGINAPHRGHASGCPASVPEAAPGLRRWAESLLTHAERDGLVWVTKAEVRAALDATPCEHLIPARECRIVGCRSTGPGASG
jgi:SAM-dependent methyltransferase